MQTQIIALLTDKQLDIPTEESFTDGSGLAKLNAQLEHLVEQEEKLEEDGCRGSWDWKCIRAQIQAAKKALRAWEKHDAARINYALAGRYPSTHKCLCLARLFTGVTSRHFNGGGGGGFRHGSIQPCAEFAR